MTTDEQDALLEASLAEHDRDMAALTARAEEAEAERDAAKADLEDEKARSEALVVSRDISEHGRLDMRAERDRLREALREVEKHVQIASCECLDLPKFSCCTCGAYEHAEALALVDRVLGIGVEP